MTGLEGILQIHDDRITRGWPPMGTGRHEMVVAVNVWSPAVLCVFATDKLGWLLDTSLTVYYSRRLKLTVI